MTEKYKQQLNELATELVTPERFGSLVLRRIQLRPSQQPGEELGSNIGSLATLYYFPEREA